MKNKFESRGFDPDQVSKTEYRIAEKSEDLKKEVMELLHEYPDNFIPGLFEQVAEQDFDESDIMVALRDNHVIGSMMFNRQTNEINWLAISKKIKDKKSAIAKELFENLYETLEPGTRLHMYVNTEDSHIPSVDDTSGRHFEPARRFYKSLGLELDEKNIIRDYYGPGSHVYYVEWEVKK